MNEGDSLRNIYVYKILAISKSIASYVSNGLGNYDFLDVKHIEEAEYANSLKLAALFKGYTLNVVRVCKCIVTYACNILTDNNVLDLVVVCAPRLSAHCIVVHCSATGNYKLTACVVCPGCIRTTASACNCRNFSFNQFDIPVILFCKIVRKRAFNYLNHHILTAVSEDVDFNCFESSRKLYGSQASAITKRQATDKVDLRTLFEGYSPHTGALEERSGFNGFYTCRNCNIGQVITVTECTITKRLQLRILFELNSLQACVLKEYVNTDVCNLVSDYHLLNRITILDGPRSINTVSGIILDCALSSKIHGAIGQENIHNVSSGITCIYNRSVIRRNECALFAEVTGITQNIDFSADSDTVSIEEVNLGIDSYVTGALFARGEITICINLVVIEETVKLCSVETNAVFTEVIVITVDLLKTGQLNTVNIVGIVAPTVCHNDTVNISFAIGINTIEENSAMALKLALGHLIVMTGCRNGSAPINNRITSCTECSAGVSVFGTCCCLVCYCFCGMNVTAIPTVEICKSFRSSCHVSIISPHFGIAEHTLTGEGV